MRKHNSQLNQHYLHMPRNVHKMDGYYLQSNGVVPSIRLLKVCKLLALSCGHIYENKLYHCFIGTFIAEGIRTSASFAFKGVVVGTASCQ